eukprot:Hpha_TRINITY_DN26229_c0_g1::TRINITY_DN26229_c0_g1_i1::g.184662::m.184662
MDTVSARNAPWSNDSIDGDAPLQTDVPRGCPNPHLELALHQTPVVRLGVPHGVTAVRKGYLDHGRAAGRKPDLLEPPQDLGGFPGGRGIHQIDLSDLRPSNAPSVGHVEANSAPLYTQPCIRKHRVAQAVPKGVRGDHVVCVIPPIPHQQLFLVVRSGGDARRRARAAGGVPPIRRRRGGDLGAHHLPLLQNRRGAGILRQTHLSLIPLIGQRVRQLPAGVDIAEEHVHHGRAFLLASHSEVQHGRHRVTPLRQKRSRGDRDDHRVRLRRGSGADHVVSIQDESGAVSTFARSLRDHDHHNLRLLCCLRHRRLVGPVEVLQYRRRPVQAS